MHDKIIIQGARFLVHLGVSVEERKKKQTIIIDCELFYPLKNAGATDDLQHTLNYSEVHALLKRLVESHEWHLIEAIAEKSAMAVLQSFPVHGIHIVVKKPGALALKDVDYCAVDIMRKK